MKTRLNERRFETADPREMLGMYLAKDVCKRWTEDFVDEDTGEVVTVKRKERIFLRGELIDQDLLAKIRFSMEADGIESVSVSDQCRKATEYASSRTLYTAQSVVGDKKQRFLLFATSVSQATEILKDYIELSYATDFELTAVKKEDYQIVLTDPLKHAPTDGDADEDGNADEDERSDDRKFYQITVTVTFTDHTTSTAVFIVRTVKVDRAMLLIYNYLMDMDAKRGDESATGQDVSVDIESVKPLPINRFIPEEFSDEYINHQKEEE